jgi:hypothetical protein
MRKIRKYCISLVLFLFLIPLACIAKLNSDTVIIDVDVRLIEKQDTLFMPDYCGLEKCYANLKFVVINDYGQNCNRKIISIETACPREFLELNKLENYPIRRYKLLQVVKETTYLVDDNPDTPIKRRTIYYVEQ